MVNNLTPNINLLFQSFPYFDSFATLPEQHCKYIPTPLKTPHSPLLQDIFNQIY
ncbi:hypothetical protein KFK09_009379 [Dendrobium nobile]|uniref:Uncharacterized protein n=1 Tax=Dendrobium nobile TaxID=94219 RepID=A0A8T3BJ85_DENNO|nr:hypothetical protein KFK09_009379 [Dendrobium nobile]